MSFIRDLDSGRLFRAAAAVSVALCICLPAAGAAALTLDQCIALGERYDARIKAQRERAAQAGFRETAARAGLLPSVDFSAAQDYREAESPAARDGLIARFTASQPLFSGYSRRAALDSARRLSARETYLIKSAARTVKSAMAQAFFAVALIQSDIRNTDETIALLNRRLQEVRDRVRLGKNNPSDQLAVESQIAAEQAGREQLAGDLVSALEDLSLLTGLPSADLAIADTLPAQETAGTLDDYLPLMTGRSDLAALRAEVAAQEYQVKAVRGSFYPAVNLNGDWTPSHAGVYGSQPDWELLLSLNLPLFRGGALKARLAESQRRLDELRIDETQLEREIAADLRKRWSMLASSISQAGALRTAYDKAAKSYAMQAKDYRLGLVNNLDVLQSMSVMVRAKLSLDRALIRTKLNRAALDIAVEKK